MNFTPEMIAAAKTADSPAALMAIARDHGITLSDSEALLYFRQLSPASGELADDELDAVSGGGCGGEPKESPYRYDVFMKVGGTKVKNSNMHCPGCWPKNAWTDNQRYILYWDHNTADSYYLYCCSCEYIWNNTLFVGDPRNHGIYPSND